MADAPARITKDFLVDIGGWDVLKQAQAIVAAGRVREVRYKPPVLSAIVLVDGRDLVTRLKIGKGAADVDNLCTCREAKEYGTICPHVIAAGWAFLQQQEQASQAYAEGQQRQGKTVAAKKSTTTAKAEKPPTWKRVLADGGAAGDKSEPLHLRLILPLTFPDTLEEKATRLTLEASRESGDAATSVAWDAIPKTLEHTYAVDEDDEALLRLLERVHGAGDPPPAMTNFPAKGYPLLLRTLHGHPRVWIGKKHRIRINALSPKPRLCIRTEPDGSLDLKLESPPSTEGRRLSLPGSDLRYEWLPAREDQPAQLRKCFTLSGPYAALLDGPVSIPAADAGNFLARELPALSRLVEIDDQGIGQHLTFDTPEPEIRARIDGSLAGVTVRLNAAYPAGAFPLEPALLEGDPPAAAWKTNPEQPMRFWKRSVPKELAALREVGKRGFRPGQKDASYFFLNQERAVGDFLANVLPRWRRRWKVSYGERFQQLLPRLEYVEPEITLQSFGSASSGEDWLSLDITPRLARGGQAASHLDPAEIQRWLQTGKSHERTGDDRILLLPTAGWREMQEVLADAQLLQEPGKMRLNPAHALGLVETIQAQGWSLSGESDWQANHLEGDPLKALPASLSGLLRPYQKQGIRWLCGLANSKFGGVLADEMGLGKTLQMLALLWWLREQNKDKTPSLVVCPTSLVDNWAAEAARFVPEMKVLALHGPGRKKLFDRMEKQDLVITSYALLRRDLPEYPVGEFQSVILDEAQHIKNRASQNAKSAKALQSAHRFVLTGTPLENSLEDLWSIFDFAMPGYMGGAKDFADRYAAPISKGDDAVQARLRHRLRPFLLRRTKEDVRDLPPKLEQVSLVDLSEEQEQAYRSLLDAGRKAVFDGSGKSGQGRNKIAVLTTLLRLRQCVCDLRLLGGKDETRGDWKEPSAKLELAMELLNEAIDGGHRVLIFSQFVRLLSLLRERLETEDIAYAYLDGSTRNRAEVVKKFQSDPSQSAFLISLKAGGTGLNLTGADTVLHLDPWWNPAVEDQATARAHRIGQDKPVTSYKLIARGTVEEKILKLQERKRELFTANVTSEELFVENLSWDEIEQLLE